MKNHIMCISKSLTDFCVKRQNLRLKKTFANIVYNDLLVKKF